MLFSKLPRLTSLTYRNRDAAAPLSLVPQPQTLVAIKSWLFLPPPCKFPFH